MGRRWTVRCVAISRESASADDSLVCVTAVHRVGLVQAAALAICFLPACHAVFGQGRDDGLATFFMGRVQYSGSRGADCAGVGQNLTQLVSQVSTIHVGEERKISLTDPQLFETPFLFMNGHNDFVYTDRELANLRTYLEHGGFLFASGCCTNPAFPAAWRREMGRLFPGSNVTPMPYDHPIYRAFYRIERVRSIHRNQNVYLEGLFYEQRLVAVICEDGLCCAFSANNACNVGRGISPDDGKKLALNIAVYAMTH